MIDYIIILLAVLCFAGQFAFTKLYENAVKQNFTTSFVMLIVTSLSGTLLYLTLGGFKIFTSPVSIFWSVMMALVMIPYYVIGIRVLSLGSLAIYSMFMMLGGMLVPFLYGIIFLKEPISASQIAGTLLLTIFIILQAVWQNGDNDKNTSKNTKFIFFILCIVIFFVNGFTGVIAKAHQISPDAVDEISFTVISCTLTAIFNMVLLAFNFCKKPKEKLDDTLSALKIKPFIIMVLIGFCCYTGNFFHLKAASNVPASVQFPLVSGGVIVFSAITSAFIFKEKLSKKEWISIAGAFVSTVLFAF